MARFRRKTRFSHRAISAAAIGAAAAACDAALITQSAAGYQPGPTHYRLSESMLRSMFEPPHDIRIEWLGDSFVGMVPVAASRLPGAFVRVMDWRGSPSGGLSAHGMVTRWLPAQNNDWTRNHVRAESPMGWFAYRICSFANGWRIFDNFNYSLHIDATWYAKTGRNWRTAGQQNEFLRTTFIHERAVDGGFNQLYNETDALAFRGLLIVPPDPTGEGAVWDGTAFLVDAGDAEPETRLPLWGGSDPTVYRGRAFRFDRASFREPWSESADLSAPTRTDPREAALNSIWFTAPGSANGDAPVLARNENGDPELALRLGEAPTEQLSTVTWSGGVLYRTDENAQPMRGPYYNTPIGVNSASYLDVDGPSANQPGNKNFTAESLRDWYWHTTLLPDRDAVVFVHYAAEAGTRAEFEQEVLNIYRTVGNAFNSFEGFTGDASVVFIVPFLHSLPGADFEQTVQIFNDLRDAAFDAADTATAEGIKAGVVSLFDHFDGVYFDGSPPSLSYLTQRGFTDFRWGNGNQIDLAAATGGDLLDGTDLHISSAQPDIGAFFATGLKDVLASAHAVALCPADLTDTIANPGEPGYGLPNGEIDGADLAFFVQNWIELNDAIADINTKNINPGDPAFGTPDGEVDGADLGYFVENWLNGCP